MKFPKLILYLFCIGLFLVIFNNSKVQQLESKTYRNSTSSISTVYHIYQSLLELISQEKYRNYLDLYENDEFQNKFNSLTDELKLDIHKKLFSFDWNKPIIQNGKLKVKRYADLIGIGSKKCGTGAFRRFLIEHPDIAKYSYNEAHFFDSTRFVDKGFSYYMERMPYVSSDQMVYEETPRYVALDGVPERIHDNLPNSADLKFIHIVCDPVGRAFSDYSHKVRWKHIGNYESFTDFVEKSVENLKNQAGTNGSQFRNSVRMLYFSQQNQHKDLTILTNGLYHLHLAYSLLGN